MSRFRSSARRLTGLLVGVAIVATAAAHWVAPASPTRGAIGRYHPNAAWDGAPIVAALESSIGSASFATHPALANLDVFSAQWTGALVVHATGLQRFVLKSDGPSWLWIDEGLVIDNGGVHSVRSLTGEVMLERGVHPVRVRYQAGKERFLQLTQSQAEGRLYDMGPLLPTRIGYVELRSRELWPVVLVALWYAALASGLVWLLASCARGGACRDLASALSDRTFLVAALVGLAMSAAHLGYGLPAHDPWSPDENTPLHTLAGSRAGFADWNLRWPPMHLYLMAAALAPFDWAARLFELPLGDVAVTSLMLAVTRLFGLLTLGATLLLVFDVARLVSDRRTGCFAVLFLALSPVVVHFGPLAHLEIPHLFWMAASLWAWVRLVGDPSPTAFAVFGATVGFSLATKDQAYGFYLAAPFACLAVIRRSRTDRRWLNVLGDRRVAVLGAATVGAFALGHGLPWHVDRFIAHVQFMMGREVGTFQMFPATSTGHVELLVATARSLVWAAGVPLTVASLAGCAVALRSRDERWLLMWLIPLATYYVGFLAVILYVYDRFLIGFLPVVAVLGGVGLRAILDARDLAPAVRLGVPALLVGMAIVGAAAQNVVFHRDPRGPAGEWLASHVPCGTSIGVVYNPQYVPALDCYDVRPFFASHIDGMVRWPDYLVLNEAYMARLRRTPSGGRFLRQLEAGELDFRLVFRALGTPPPWAPLYWEERFRNGREDSQTTLDKPLNAIEVWERKR